MNPPAFGTTGLSLAQLQMLRANNPTFFDQEANVNGMWYGFLAAFFPSNSAGASYLIAPESVALGGTKALRADLNVLQLSAPPPPTHPQTQPPPYITLTYEVKRENEGRKDFGTIIGQLQIYATNANVPSASGRTFYGVAAIGTKFRLFVKLQETSLVSLNISQDGRLRNRGKAEHATYDVVDDYGLLVVAMRFMANNTYPANHLFT